MDGTMDRLVNGGRSEGGNERGRDGKKDRGMIHGCLQIQMWQPQGDKMS